jgi:spectinomycin phosphotransferase
MLEKPDLSDELIVSSLQAEYNLRVAGLTFLPIGADQGSAVYRIVTKDGLVYFLKLRKAFNEIVVSVPLFLQSQGVDAIIAPFATKSNQYWADFGDYKMILYPFIEGKNGFEMEVTDDLKQELGAVLRSIHTLTIPLELKREIPRETYSSYWCKRLQDLQRQVEKTTFGEPSAAKLAIFMQTKRNEIRRLIQRTEELASELQSESTEFVLCHTDIHGGNILIRTDGPLPVLYIVDWDNPLLAPRERDLMFVGGGIDDLWKSEHDEAVFYQGYGMVNIDFAVMAYYRYERVIEDLVAYGDQLLLSDEGGADREPAYRRFAGNFEPGSTIEMAKQIDIL